MKKTRHGLALSMVVNMLLILTLSFGVSVGVFRLSAGLAQKELGHANMAILRQNMERIEEMLRKTDELTVDFMMDNVYMNPFMSSVDQAPPERYRMMREFVNFYESLTALYPDKVSLYLHSNINGNLFLNGALYSKREKAYEEWIVDVFEHEQAKEQWRDAHLQNYSGYHQFVPGDCVVLVRNYPIGASQYYVGRSAVVVEESVLSSVLGQSLPSASSSAFILSQDGALIASDGQSALEPERIAELAALEPEQGVLSKLHSTFTGWTYVLYTPSAQARWFAPLIRGWTSIILCYCAIVLVIWCTMMQRTYRPLRHLALQVGQMAGLNELERSYNELVYIENAFTRLVMQSRELEDDIQRYRPAMRAKLISDLLHAGAVMDFVSHTISLRTVGVTVYADWFVVCLVWGSGIKDESLTRAFEMGGFRKEGMDFVCIALDADRFAVLLSAQASQQISEEQLALRLECIQSHIEQTPLAIGVGSVCTDYMSVPLSYSAADRALKQCMLLEGKGIYLSSADAGDTNRIAAMRSEIGTVVLALRATNNEEMDRAIRALYDAMRRQRLDRAMVLTVGNQLLISGLQTAAEFDLDLNLMLVKHPIGLLAELENCVSLDEMECMQVSTFRLFAQNIDYRKNYIGSARQTDRLLRYLDEHYDYTNLNANSLARVFSLTPSHLSHIFKGNTGMNVSVYLTQLRVEKAKVLLSGGQQSVAQIAECVGYANLQTFTRAFKKNTGLTPGAWREQKKPEKTEM